mmetsp:Transcript_62291/g.165341  ORF Transcript_62291/g.165341 Transcript_62291/m.165341 type:complete len:318 (-) Transcript_62291:4260-5213(-)
MDFELPASASRGSDLPTDPATAPAVSCANLANDVAHKAQASAPPASASSKNLGAIFQFLVSSDRSKSAQLGSPSTSRSSSRFEDTLPPEDPPQSAAQHAATPAGGAEQAGASVVRTAATSGPLNSQDRPRNSGPVGLSANGAVVWGTAVDITHAGGGSGHDPADGTVLVAALPVLRLKEEKPGPDEPPPSRALHAHCACGPEMCTSQNGHGVLKPLPASPNDVPMITAVSRGDVPVPDVTRSSSPGRKSGTASVFVDGGGRMTKLLGAVPSPVSVPDTRQGTVDRSKVNKKPGSKSSVELGPALFDAPGPASNSTNR